MSSAPIVIPQQTVRTSRLENVSCQQLQGDSTLWVGVAEKIHTIWSRCLHETQALEESIEKDANKRANYAKYFEIFGYIMIGSLNALASLSFVLPFIKYDIPTYVPSIIQGATLVITGMLWARPDKKNMEYLTIAGDLTKLKEMCRKIRRTLREVISDGKITNKELFILKDMIGQIHSKSGEIGSMSMVMNLYGGPQGGKKLFGKGQKEYQAAFEGVNDIIEEIGRSQQEIKATVPHIVREIQDSQLQVQIHSAANPHVAQREPARSSAHMSVFDPDSGAVQV